MFHNSKGSNILKVAGSEDIKLADTGLSGLLSQVTDNDGLKRTKMNSVYWMAPEIVEMEPKDYKTSTDIW